MKKIVSVFAGIFTALALLTGSIALPILVRPFYYAQIKPLEIPESVGLEVSEIKEAYRDVLDYCIGLSDDFSAGVLTFSDSGAAHFADVRVLFILDLVLFAVSIIALVLIAIWRRGKNTDLAKVFGRGPGFWGTAVLMGVIILVGCFAAMDFDTAFTLFHKVFFPGKTNWVFDVYTDPVILMLPMEFFRNCAIAIAAALLLAGSVVIVRDFAAGDK